MTEQPRSKLFQRLHVGPDDSLVSGCGDYSILSQVQTAFASLGLPKRNSVISGLAALVSRTI